MVTSYWTAGARLTVRAHTSLPGRGLTYPAGEVTATEAGCVGGWDVYDVAAPFGNHDAIYGFSVERIDGEPAGIDPDLGEDA